MGGEYLSNFERYQACDPYLLYSDEIQLTIIHGEKDKCVSIKQAEKYYQNANSNTELIIIPEADHFSMLPHDGFWQESQWKTVKKSITQQIEYLGKTETIS